ncbi:hypothetical protein MKK68_15785 [Methylobacterium sp. E-016]|uniref:hypothetical protein n=1 Tax=Methylobacterium sp. E-016 TaxID=2836556 RepID=UPI001FB8C795|nr:hypothetical protein [Methylobacterium sp. E-016]MCJ2077094.1 hypothetical protein [Methylobacterium sp. E-016]
MVPEGPPQGWLDPAGVRHLALGPGGAGGAGPARAVGGLLAASAGYAAIGFLDAECWYDDDHVERCLTAALAVGLDRCGGVSAARRFRRPDLSAMPLRDEDPAAFVDASCYLFLPAGFGLIGRWALIPTALAPVGDRLFFLGARASGLVTGRTRCASVNAVAAYAVAYAALGEVPPPTLGRCPTTPPTGPGSRPSRPRPSRACVGSSESTSGTSSRGAADPRSHHPGRACAAGTNSSRAPVGVFSASPKLQHLHEMQGSPLNAGAVRLRSWAELWNAPR